MRHIIVNRARIATSLIAMAALWMVNSGRSQDLSLSPVSWPGAELFTNSVAREMQITLGVEALASLQRNPRGYVAGTVIQGDTTWSHVGVHLKGAVGSFRPLEDKPGLTLDFGRFENRQQFHSLRKIHLNNSVEDPSYVNEIIGSQLFRAGGVPAPRVTRVLVRLNGRACGLYVLKEGFTEDFLTCHFQHISGELYEPMDGHDVDQKMNRNSVLAPAGSRAALTALADAALEPDLSQRWQRLGAVLDRDRFLAFMSVEIMLGHRDGYCMFRNNFRVYHDLDSDRMIFFPHGMDQLFGTPDLTWQPALGGLVAKAVMETPQGEQLYRERFGLLFTNLFKLSVLTGRVDQLVADLRPALKSGEWAAIRDAAVQVKERIAQRHDSLAWQLAQPPLRPVKFEAGAARLDGWRIAEAPLKGTMDRANGSERLPSLHISITDETSASWRTTALVPRGRYRFEGRVRIASVQGLSYGAHAGAGLRVRGHTRQSESFTGDSSWRVVASEFQVEQSTEEIEFICELRARAGEAWFQLSSLRLVQLGDL
jgi:spore coat protein H